MAGFIQADPVSVSILMLQWQPDYRQNTELDSRTYALCYSLPGPRNTLSIRLENYDAHRNYLNTTQTNIVLAGPVTAADQSTPIGSFMIICVDHQEEAERFNHGDPFYRLNVWDKASIRIQPFIKRRGWSEDTCRSSNS